MSDLINRAEAIRAVMDLPDCLNGFSDTYDKARIIGVLEELPSAEPEIIRCKDCKWYGRADKRRFYRGMDCLQKRIDTINPDKDFCSRAERRENGGMKYALNRWGRVDRTNRKNICEPCKKRKNDYNGVYCRACRYGNEIDDIEDAPTVGEWIPCSERLPEDVEIGEEYPTVIFCTADGVVRVGGYEHYLGGKWWYMDTWEDEAQNVIAWMPLPEPYREGEE